MRKILPIIFLIISFLIYLTLFSYLSILKHYSFNSSLFDLGIFEQTIWNTSKGKFFQQSLSLVSPGNFLGDHFSLILLFLALIYRIIPKTETLLICQTIFLASGIFPLYLIGIHFLKNRWAALFIGISYLLYPALEFANLFDFHIITLIIPLIFWGFYFYFKNKKLVALLFFLLALLVKEDISLIILGIGFFMIIQKDFKFGSFLSVLSLCWFFLTTKVFIPYFNSSTYGYLYRYKFLGNSFSQILITILTKPIFTLKYAFSFKKVLYLRNLFKPVCYLSIFGGPIIIPLLITLSFSLLSNYSPQFSIKYHYSISSIPFIFLGIIFAIVNISKLVNKKQPIIFLFSLLIFLTSFFTNLDLGPKPFLLFNEYKIENHQLLLKEFLNQIPEKVPVSAQNTIGPHLIKREKIYRFPVINDAEFIILDLKATNFGVPEKKFKKAVKELKNNPDFCLIKEKDKIMLFKKC